MRKTLISLLSTVALAQNSNREQKTSVQYCDDNLRAAKCSKSGTLSCEIIGSDPGHRCNCKPGFSGPECGEFNYELKCDQSHVLVKARKSYFDAMNITSVRELHLNDDKCIAVEEDDPIDGTIYYKWKIVGNPRNCGSDVTSNGTYLKYSNAIRDAENTANNKLVTRSRIEIQFHCTFPVDYRVGLKQGLKPKVRTITIKTAKGKFVVDMKLFQDQGFQREWLPEKPNMPIEIAKGQYIYVQLALVNILADSANRLIADQCWATPSPNPADATAAMIVQTACPQESSVVMFSNGNDRTVRYKMQMFSFAQYPNANIHVHCVVRICGEECEPTCAGDVPTQRKRRAIMENEVMEVDGKEELAIITSTSIKVETFMDSDSQEGKITRDGDKLAEEGIKAGVSDGVLVIMIIVLVLVVGGIGVGVFMMVQRRRTALAEEILQNSEKPKMAPQSAAGTSFSIFYGH